METLTAPRLSFTSPFNRASPPKPKLLEGAPSAIGCPPKLLGRGCLPQFRGAARGVARRGVITGMARAPASASNYLGIPEKMEQVPQSTPAASPFMQERMDFVKAHFQYCFKDVLDKEHIDDHVYFQDPWTKFTFFKGYQFNINFLREFLRPIYELHDVRQSPKNENEILVRWTMSMQLWWNRFLPSKFVWDPRMVFSGITVLGVNPSTGKINKHVDMWDALDDNDFFSLEGVRFVLGQMFSLSRPMDAETPEFQILKRYKNYEVRKYKPFLAVKAGLGATDAYHTPLQRGHDADDLLQAYFDGSNGAGERIAVTTPVFRDSKGQAWRYLGDQFKNADEVPKPQSEHVTVEERPGGFFAATLFSGAARKEDVQQRWILVTEEAQRDGLKLSSSDWALAEYNSEWTLGPWRRNEVLVPMDETSFKLWEERLPH